MAAHWSENRQESRALEEFTSPRVTDGAPHVRDAIHPGRVVNGILLALVPSILLGLYNTGHQANLALAGAEPATGWRGRLLAYLAIQNDPGNPWECLFQGTLHFLPAFLISLVLAWFWQILFAKLRNRPSGDGFLVTAVLFTLLLPPNAPLWQVALGISFGVILAQEVFGGSGKNFVNPALAGLVFLHLAYSSSLSGSRSWEGLAGYAGTTLFSTIAAAGPAVLGEAGLSPWNALWGILPGPMGSTSALAAGLGAVLLVRRKLASGRVMVGVLVGLLGGLALFRIASSHPGPLLALSWYWHLTLGNLAFATVFLAPDPVTSASTNPGRCVYGGLIGFMVVLIRSQNPLHPDGVILAVLLGNVFAPLIDSFFVWLNVRRRRHAC